MRKWTHVATSWRAAWRSAWRSAWRWAPSAPCCSRTCSRGCCAARGDALAAGRRRRTRRKGKKKRAKRADPLDTSFRVELRAAFATAVDDDEDMAAPDAVVVHAAGDEVQAPVRVSYKETGTRRAAPRPPARGDGNWRARRSKKKEEAKETTSVAFAPTETRRVAVGKRDGETVFKSETVRADTRPDIFNEAATASYAATRLRRVWIEKNNVTSVWTKFRTRGGHAGFEKAKKPYSVSNLSHWTRLAGKLRVNFMLARLGVVHVTKPVERREFVVGFYIGLQKRRDLYKKVSAPGV